MQQIRNKENTVARRIAVINAMALACLLLGACGEGALSERIGMERKAPDEFRVLSRPPLNVPPEFSLRPPSNVEDGGGLTKPASRQAESLVLGTEEPVSGLSYGSAPTAVMSVTEVPLTSSADSSFLGKAGAESVDPLIRETLRQENGYYEDPSEKTMLEKLREPFKGEPTVDAKKEKERLRANQQEGKPVTEGDVPVIKPKDRGVIGKIF